MADIVGLASSIIQVVDLGWKVATTLNEFCSMAHGVPSVLRNIDAQLPQLVSSLDTLKDKQYLASLTEKARMDLQRLLEACNEQITLLKAILAQVKPADEDSIWDRSQMALYFLLKQDKLKKIVKELDRFKWTLTLHFVHSAHKYNVRSSSIPSPQSRQIHNIPPLRANNFVPREELLAELLATVDRAPSSPSPKVIVVLGMGGQGKTQLLLEYCYRCLQVNPPFNYIFWVDASYVNSMMQCFRHLAKMVGSGHVLDSPDEAVQFVKDVLASSTKSWLMVFDNFDHPEDCQNISEFFPLSGNGTILISSRNAMTVNLGQVIHVSGMTEREGLQLLLASDENLENEQRVLGERIVQMLGHLPLAIDQAHAYIHTRQLSLDEFLRDYQLRKKYILQLTPAFTKYKRQLGDVQKEKALSVFTTWEMSLDQLSTNTKEPVKQFLLISAFFHPSHISEELFKDAVDEDLSVSECLTTLTTEGVWDHFKYQDMLVEMHQLSLIQSLWSEEDRTVFSLHPLVSEWLRLRVEDEEKLKSAQEMMLLLRHQVDKTEEVSLKIKNHMLAHINASEQNTKDLWEKFDTDDQQKMCHWYLGCSNFYESCGLYNKGEMMAERAMAGYEKILGSDDTATLDAACNLGIHYMNQGKLAEAERMFGKALECYEKTLGPDDVSTLRTVHHLGNLYKEQNRLADAEKMFGRVLTGYGKALGPDHVSTLNAVNNLGILYKTQSKLAEAEKMYDRALAGYEKALGTDHITTLCTINNLGNLYSNKGRPAEAEKLLERALAGYERILGPDHISTLNVINNLGFVYSDQDKFAEAERMYERALAEKEKIYGPESIITLESVHSLGNYLSLQNRLPEAEKLYIRALTGFEKAFGPGHNTSLSTIMNLGIVYCCQDRLDEAETMFKKALAGNEMIFGPDNIATLNTIHSLGHLYKKQGKLAEAEEMYEKTLCGREKILGPDHVNTLTTVNNLGNLYKEQGRVAEAEKMYERALSGREKTLGPDHAETLVVVDNLGQLYRDQERLIDAERMCERALAGYEKTLGPEHETTLDAVQTLGDLYEDEGRLADAERMYKRALAGYQDTLGPDHSSTVETARALDGLYRDQTEQLERKVRKRHTEDL